MTQLSTRSESTKYDYLRNFRLFCEWLNETPDGIIAQRKKDLKSDDQKTNHHYEVKLKEYIAHLRDESRSTATQKIRYAATRSFFDSHYMPLKLRRSDAPSGESIGSRISEKFEIRKMMDLAPDLKWRALISFLKDCGWRIGDVIKLTWNDLNKIESDFWYFQKLTEKRKVMGIGFIGPETVELLNLYRKQREARREKIEGNSPIFPSRARRYANDFLTANATSDRISKLAKTAGAKNVTAHSLRKFFRASLEPHVNPTWIKTMMGKKIMGSTDAYTEKRPEKILEAYKSAYDALKLEEGSKLTPKEEKNVKEMAKMMEAIKTKGKYEEWAPNLTEEEKEKWKAIITKMFDFQKVDKDDSNEEDCQRIIKEDELDEYLSKRWKVQAILPSGRIVIDNEH